MIRKFCGVSRSEKKLKILQGGEGGRGVVVLDVSDLPQPSFVFFFWNSPLLNGLNSNLGNLLILTNSLLRLFYQIKMKAV